MKKVILAALALVPALALANPGAYVQAQAGVNAVDPSTGPGVSANTATGFVGGVGAGYLWGDNTVNYGVELDGMWYPSSTGTANFNGFTQDINTKYDGYNISLLGILKYTSCSTGFVVFGKAGAAYVHQKLTLTNVPFFGTAEGTASQVAPEVALGVGYQFNPNWEVDLTADAVFTSSNNNTTGSNDPDQNGNLTLGVVYHFV